VRYACSDSRSTMDRIASPAQRLFPNTGRKSYAVASSARTTAPLQSQRRCPSVPAGREGDPVAAAALRMRRLAARTSSAKALVAFAPETLPGASTSRTSRIRPASAASTSPLSKEAKGVIFQVNQHRLRRPHLARYCCIPTMTCRLDSTEARREYGWYPKSIHVCTYGKSRNRRPTPFPGLDAQKQSAAGPHLRKSGEISLRKFCISSPETGLVAHRAVVRLGET
jgi:hypothetical protein